MNVLITKIKNNFKYFLIPIIFISFLLINLNVVYFGDDYYYLSFRNLNFTEYFSGLFNHYCQDNGRFIVHLFATLFLKFPMPFWQILNSLMLTGICYFITKILTTKDKSKMPLILSISFFIIASLSINITRQSTYWLTGSFNYIYPIFLLFAYWFSLLKIDNKRFFIIAIILGFFSAASMEQNAMMTFGLTILTLFAKFKNLKSLMYLKNWKEVFKTNKRLILLCLITFIGVCTVILAPAQFVRIQKEETDIPLSTTVINNSKFLLYNYISDSNILPYAILFNLLSIAYLFKNEKNIKVKIFIFAVSILNIILTTLNIYFLYGNLSSNAVKLVIDVVILLMYLINFIYINKQVYKKCISPLTISAILLVGSQAMMIISPVLGHRNLIFGLMMFLFIICIIASKIDFKFKNIFTSVLILLAIIVNIHTAKGYYQTKLIDTKNIEIISYSQDIINDKNQEITLYKFLNDDYGWSMPYVSSYHEYWFKNFYNMKCKINWVYPE